MPSGKVRAGHGPGAFFIPKRITVEKKMVELSAVLPTCRYKFYMTFHVGTWDEDII